MTDKPILFSSLMVRAILDEQKTQTRRVVKPPPRDWFGKEWIEAKYKCPYPAGTRLWVRETWKTSVAYDDCSPSQIDPKATILWIADGSTRLNGPEEWGRIRQSIFMPRWASRITLEVTAVRVERLQEISEKDARAEGVKPFGGMCVDRSRHIKAFELLWDSINNKPGKKWVDTPWCWVIDFNRGK